MEFKDKIRGIRKQMGLSQTEFAQKIGIGMRTVQNYEMGVRLPTHEILKKISRTLDVPVDYLLDEKELFVYNAAQDGGTRSKTQALQFIDSANALFAGGELNDEDRDLVMQALQDMYWKAKQNNKKYSKKSK